MLMASAVQAISVDLPELIEVTATNQSQHSITVTLSHQTDDYGKKVESDERVVGVRVPFDKGNRQLTSMSLLLSEPSKHLSVPLSFSREKDAAAAQFSIDIALIRAGTVFAAYTDPKDKKDLGVEYLIRLKTYTEQNKGNQNNILHGTSLFAPTVKINVGLNKRDK